MLILVENSGLIVISLDKVGFQLNGSLVGGYSLMGMLEIVEDMAFAMVSRGIVWIEHQSQLKGF